MKKVYQTDVMKKHQKARARYEEKKLVLKRSSFRTPVRMRFKPDHPKFVTKKIKNNMQAILQLLLVYVFSCLILAYLIVPMIYPNLMVYFGWGLVWIHFLYWPIHKKFKR